MKEKRVGDAYSFFLHKNLGNTRVSERVLELLRKVC